MDANSPNHTSISPCAKHPFPITLGELWLYRSIWGLRGNIEFLSATEKTEGAETVPPPSVCVVSAAPAPSVLHDENAVETLLGGTHSIGLLSGAASCRYGAWDINPDWV